ncbi:hypothetical protein NAU58_10430 [Pseudomonas stutzeri]|uniref:Uncharacterized protein n=1 Tax=Stutzerimonas stutzeri TaxID=316 RepID=A0A2N8RYG0_STUST|nr:hypothetical protein [Stutzerimonas stutzeri]MCQ4295994.1 hypothetical protein [Stutzerimonas stutzeri]PNF79405.1 hypothetical protein CXK92_18030 [Stutzerimonas stutzeri]
MLTMTLAAWLLAATPAPADAPVHASLELQPVEDHRLSLALCFKGSGQQVRFRLKVRSSGKAGNAQTTQGGTLTATATQQCPLSNRLGITEDSRVEAELHWWIDDAEQPPILRSYPNAEHGDDEEQNEPQQIA